MRRPANSVLGTCEFCGRRRRTVVRVRPVEGLDDFKGQAFAWACWTRCARINNDIRAGRLPLTVGAKP